MPELAGRRMPGSEVCDFAPLFGALKKAKYDGRISIEGKIENPAEELPIALAMMKSLMV